MASSPKSRAALPPTANAAAFDSAGHVVCCSARGYNIFTSAQRRLRTSDRSCGVAVVARVSDAEAVVLLSDCRTVRIVSLVTPPQQPTSSTTTSSASLQSPVAGDSAGGGGLPVTESVVRSELLFADSILNILTNGSRLVIVQTEKMHVLDYDTLEPLPQVRTSCPPNAAGLASLGAVSVVSGKCHLAVPQSGDSNQPGRGDVMVVEATTCTSVTVVSAQQSRVAVLCFSPNGECFATCSQRGQTIRLFSVSGLLLYAFRRGSSEALVHSVALSFDGGILACSSSTGTIHVFRASDAKADSDGTVQAETRSFCKLQGPTDRTALFLEPDGRQLVLLTPTEAQLGSATLSRYALEDSGKSKLLVEFHVEAP